MSTPTFAKTHNLIAFLEKPSESDGFEQIVDFLNANQIKYALMGTSCLPNAVIFEELARMGAKTTSWNEFSSTMASAIICLANNQKFNFSKYILDNLKKNVKAGVPFYMFPSVVQDTPILDAPSTSQPQRKHKPRRKERKETKVSPTELQQEDYVPTTSNDPLPSENEVIKMKSSHKAKIAELESRVEKLKEENRSLTKKLKSFNTKVESLAFKETVVDKEKSSKQGRKITDIDADVEVNLENVYNLDMAHEEIVLSMQDVADVDVSTAGGEVNAANEEPVSAALTNTTTAQPSEATKTTIDITTAPKAKGIVFHDMEESITRTNSSKVQVKDKGKTKLVEEPKVLKLRKAQIGIDKEVTRRIEALIGIKLLNMFKVDNRML
nr:hypothetical protein [Tanacetum cinerariifolium]